MDAPPPPPPRRLMSRRNLFRLVGAGAALGVSAEFARVALGWNEHTVIPGKVYRAAQFTQSKMQRVIADKGIRTVLNLRGCCWDANWYLGDARAAHAANISHEDVTLSARRHPAPNELRRLIEVFDHTDYPVLIHCNRGADRTGLASTVALLLLTDADLDTARRQLWPRYGHVSALARTWVLDEVIDDYAAALARRGEAHTPARFRAWAAEEYCPGPYRANLSVVDPVPLAVPAGAGFAVTVRAVNRSPRPWEFTPGGRSGVHLRCILSGPSNDATHRVRAGLFARSVAPGGSIDIVVGFPPRTPGRYSLHADLVEARPIEFLDSTFTNYGSEPLTTPLTVA